MGDWESRAQEAHDEALEILTDPAVEMAYLFGDVTHLAPTFEREQVGHWVPPDPVLCPECVADKHGNCTGDALDPDTDKIVDCQCPRCI